MFARHIQILGLAEGRVWQGFFNDFVVFTEETHIEKLHHMERNAVVRGQVVEPQQWSGSSFRHYAFNEPRSRAG
jgi:hypothetical protein